MNLITFFVTLFSILIIVLGGLLGWYRGAKRSAVLLGLVAVTFVVAWFLCPLFAKLITSAKIEVATGAEVESVTLIEYIHNTLTAQELPVSLVSLIVNTIVITAEVIMFITSFLGILFFMWILPFNLIKLCFKKDKKKKKGKKKREKGDIIGGILLGVLSGIIVAYTTFVPVTGLAHEIAKASKIKIEGEPAIKLEQSYDVNDYIQSPFGKLYDTTGSWLFKHIATTVDDNSGKKVNLSDNIDVVVVATEILDEAVKISNTDFSEGLNEENVSTLVESLTKMEESKDSLSEEATEIFNEILVDLSSSLGEELPISIPEDFDFSKVNFKEAADAIEVVYDYSKSEEPELTEEQVDTIVNAFADNMVIIEALGTEQLVELDDTSKDLVEEKLNDVIAEEKLTQEQIDLIKGLLGINK